MREPAAPFPESCPICEARGLERSIDLPGLRVARCRACGHRVAIHDTKAPGSLRDYHEQYDGGPFLEALRATRVRQAALLIGRVRRHVPSLSGLVDYGAGRGWFLEACRSAGVAPIAGLDTSPMSVEGLKRSGIEAHRLPDDEALADVFSRLPFRPRVVSLLDVIEHFPPERLRARVRGIVAACGADLELVVVKVPLAGLLYAGATALCGLGAPGPLRQLYQVGTWPPHFNYFSGPSAETLLASAGLSVIERLGDPDFEPGCFGQRIGAKGPAGRALARIGGEALAAAVRVSGRFDSMVLFARPASPGRLRDP
jgi:methyltransferase family protein